MTVDRPQDLDLSSLLRVLRRAALPILIVALAVSTLVYFYSSTRPAVYQATASLSALPTSGGNSVINNTLVTAPQLPPGVVARAMRSPAVVDGAVSRLQAAVPDSPARRAFVEGLQLEARTGRRELVRLSTDVNQDFVGVYEISALAATPQLAQAAANSFSASLLEWDRQRALTGITRARQNLVTQRADLTARIARGGNALDLRTLEQLRLDIVERLQQVEVLEQTVSGTLNALASATPPTDPAAPRPLRDTLLSFAACVFFGTLLAFALDQMKQRIRGLEDLRSFGLPVLGTLPPLPFRSADPTRVIQAIRHGLFREQMEFVRVGVMSSLGNLPSSPIIVVSSGQVGEGKSTVTAGLAYTMAEHGMRVLVVDADIFRRRQENLWLAASRGREAQTHQMGEHQLRTGVADGIDLLTVQTSTLNTPMLELTVRTRSRDYDVVLVDTPPVLKIADTLVLASHLDGLVVVTDPQTSHAQIRRVIEDTGRLGVPVLGLVLNRFRETSGQSEYTYASLGQEPQPPRSVGSRG
ncbi:P-loop NTPase [Deinococcus aerophilus]|uniref:ExoP n=1 Tax=Deinococcus aerophilus TaxID=522488 RepID=A0ABQ2GIN8_9DEIO|nr:P-loop NTPase [Deinococcus aerophilus]GGL98397.1 exoP [Deinococcus aerophilus]